MKNTLTEEECKLVALKCHNMTKFIRTHYSAYYKARKMGWLSDICAHMEHKQKPTRYWNNETCKVEASKYKTRKEFRENNTTAYNVSKSCGYLDDICQHMELSKYKPMGYWTHDNCKLEALKYDNMTDFSKKSQGAYISAKKGGFIKNITNHFIRKQHKKGYWTKELCHEAALKYDNKSDFSKHDSGAQNASRKYGWFEYVTSHMTPKGNKNKRCVYSYTFIDKSVYVGLTYDLDKRQRDRDCLPRDQVTKYINNTGFIACREQLTEYIDVNEAILLEEYYINKYREEGFKILNVAKSGGIGGKLKWDFENCKKEAAKYKSRSEFKKKAKGASASSYKFGWIDEVCSHMIRKQKPTSYWNKERCRIEALKYNNSEDFVKGCSSAYSVSKKNKFFDEICSHFIKKQSKYTKEVLFQESLNYLTKSEFYKKNRNMYEATRKNKWLDEFYPKNKNTN